MSFTKHFRLATLFVIFTLLFSCSACSSSSQKKVSQAQKSQAEFIQHLRETTVSLVQKTSSGYRAYCTGALVADDLILTAYHCVESEDMTTEVGNYLFVSFYDDTDITASKVLSAHMAVVYKVSPESDLALVKVMFPNTTLSRPFLKVSTKEINDGDTIYLSSNPLGMLYSFSMGRVSNTRNVKNASGILMKVLQTYIPGSYGSSGSGLVDSDGNLIGVCSYSMPRNATSLFFVHRDLIAKFLQDI
jgi:S1-C subfamily serine protease